MPCMRNGITQTCMLSRHMPVCSERKTGYRVRNARGSVLAAVQVRLDEDCRTTNATRARTALGYMEHLFPDGVAHYFRKPLDPLPARRSCCEPERPQNGDLVGSTVCCRLQSANSVVLCGRPFGLYQGNPAFREKVWYRRFLCYIVQQSAAADAQRGLEMFCLLEARTALRRSRASNTASVDSQPGRQPIFPYRRANIL